MQEIITANIIEKEIITADITDKEIITVDLTSVDILDYYRKYLEANLIKETPTAVNPLPSKQFITSKAIVTGSLSVYFNGIKEHYTTIIDSTTFDMPIDIISSDIIEVEYIEET